MALSKLGLIPPPLFNTSGKSGVSRPDSPLLISSSVGGGRGYGLGKNDTDNPFGDAIDPSKICKVDDYF